MSRRLRLFLHDRVRSGVIACAVLLLPAALQAAPPAGSPSKLWSRAVELCRKAVVPSRALFKTEVTNGKGKVISRAEFSYRIEIEKGRPRLLVVKATEDGKDVTKRYRQAGKKPTGKKRESKHQTTINLSPWYTPFSPSAQDRTKVKPEGEAVLKGRQAAVFSFRQDDSTGKRAVEGRAWLDASTGVPIKVVVHPDPLPRHVDSLDTTIWYEKGTGGTLFPVRTRIEGGGGFLWIHRKVVTRVVSSGFRLLNPSGP